MDHTKWGTQRTKHFAVVTSRGPGGPVFHLAGEINGSSASQVIRHLKQCPECTLVLDFSEVTEIGEFGARVLATGLNEVRKAGVAIDVDGLRQGLAQVLCLGGVFEAIVGRT